MKSLLEQKDDSLDEKNKLKIKENNHLCNHFYKLAADHDVTISNTMIKITYKKALKDQNSVDNTFDCNTNLDFTNGKNKPSKVTNLCNSDISVIMKSPKLQKERNKVFQSLPKQALIDAEKKKYVNGLNLTAKPNNSEGMSCIVKLQKISSLQEDSALISKKSKSISSKQTTRPESDKRFLKSNSLVKQKTSIIQKDGAEIKKMKITKASKKKIKKLDNGVKRKTGGDKKPRKIVGLKRKASNTDHNALVKCKKIKMNESKTKPVGSPSIEERGKNTSKKRIMLVDPDLPTGWTRFIRTKNKGSPNEQYVVYVVNPQGKKFRFKWKLRKYLQRTNSSLDVNQFFFGLYQRPKTSNASAIETDEKPKSNATSLSGEIPSNNTNEVDSDQEPENQMEENEGGKNVNPYETSSSPSRSSDGKEILFFDPDLPFGWKRIIHSNSSNGRKQVHIISPDGKIFRRRYRLHEYLVKHQYTHNLDRFYFGLYPKKEGTTVENFWKGTQETAPPGLVKMYKPEDSVKIGGGVVSENDVSEFEDDPKIVAPHSPMYDDPNLPEGWKRFIKIRSCGESAGRMEVVIVSPEGRRHRSRKHLEHYLTQKQLNYKAEDFDFTVFGRSKPKKRPPSAPTPEPGPEPELERDLGPVSNDTSFLSTKKKFTDKPVAELDINSIKEAVITPEGHMINTVNGLMMCSGLSTARNERRQRLPRGEHEKQLKSYLSSENEASYDGCQIPTHWVQKLVKCRGDFRILEPDAALTIAETTKEFIKKVSLEALNKSEQSETGLKYEDVAELVDSMDCLSFLKTLIPKKITFREYIKLNRPKQFMSFT